MKKTTLLFLLIVTCITTVYGQDTLTMVNGDLIKSKVIEITQTEIKYKKFENMNGPIFNILKSEVLLIRYENGTKEYLNVIKKESKTENRLEISSGYYQGTTKLSITEFKNIIKTNPKAYHEYKKGFMTKIIGLVVAFPSMGILAWYTTGGDFDTDMIISGGLGLVGGYLTAVAGQNLIKKSAKTYNENFDKVSYNFNVNSNGIGLAIRF